MTSSNMVLWIVPLVRVRDPFAKLLASGRESFVYSITPRSLHEVAEPIG